ncbi:uncharacterized protein F4822DRAFT_343370 [Hypoxylon trugodes]|uniref:uncharacterized protein n=1 Tax=Hypoxylon trugodes TaxID=326681 RepID=UPI0021A0A2D5|nr:uncharacterized protein F4822DRAFT_343370 [Hypoxylon trugodes]KAI1385403.1 hypothetical protein F4822DRAFT_343370 [Hypoxylon trugodes]
MITVNKIPPRYPGKIKIEIRERDLDIISRIYMIINALILPADSPPTPEDIVHLWYSAFMPESLDKWIRGPFYRHVEKLCREVYQRSEVPKRLLANFIYPEVELPIPYRSDSDTMVDLTLSFPKWFRLIRLLRRKPAWKEAREARELVMACPERLDSRQRYLARQPCGERPSHEKFAYDGILLPYGRNRSIFTKPNFTLFDCLDDELRWIPDDTMSPEHGWSRSEFHKFHSGLARNDVLGKLYYYLVDVITTFRDQIHSLDIKFHITHSETRHLVGPLRADRPFDRILVSGIDENYIPIDFTGWLGTFLKPSNPHATLIAPYRQPLKCPDILCGGGDIFCFHEIFKCDRTNLPGKCTDKDYNTLQAREVEFLEGDNFERIFTTYLPLFYRPTRLWRGIDLLLSRNLSLDVFGGDWRTGGIDVKKTNTIVEQWPYRSVKKGSRRIGASGNMQAYLAEDRYPALRYIEWERVGDPDPDILDSQSIEDGLCYRHWWGSVR